jgi:tetratricopeptide (TPR) repeat protein
LNHQSALREALAHHQAGRLPQAERIYERILASEPSHVDALHLLGVAAHQSGAHARAVELIAGAVEAAPDNALYLNNLGEAHRALGDWQQAAQCYRRCLIIDPCNAPAHNNLGLVHAAENRLEAAEASFRAALVLVPDDPEVHANLGDVLARDGQTADAIACFQRALALEPGLGPVHGRLGQLHLDNHSPVEAGESFARALAIQPDDADAHAGLAGALLEQHRFDEAEAAARAALGIAPQHDSASLWLGYALFHQGRYEQASDAFLAPARGLRAIGSHAQDRHSTFSQISRTKLQQDMEQLDYLIGRGRLPGEYCRLPRAYEDFAARHAGSPDRTVMLEVPFDDAIAPYFNRLVIDSPEPAILGGALNPDLDVGAIEAAFHANPAGYTQFDALLNDEALAALQRYCLEASIWFEMKFHSEVGSSLCNGFCCPLLLQIAAEIRTTFPSVFGKYLFATCWTYKYFQDDGDGHIHADNGAASVNLWITPDESNLEANAGGLLLWNKSVPDEYFDATGEEMARISQALIGQPDAEAGYVSYACNRAMMFRSNVLHKTHRLKFKDAYPHRRVSITFLYGKPGQ